MINKREFYKLLNEGLLNKYCRAAGPVQEMSIVYKKERDVRIVKKRKEFDTVAVDFIGDFIEEKTIYADLSNPLHTETRLNEIRGTLFVRDNLFEDLMLEL